MADLHMMTRTIKPAKLEQYRRLTTCLVASAIETFRVRLPNTGFADSSIRCIFEDQPPMAGYAATARMRSSNPRMEIGKSYDYYDRTDWWNNILSIPAPRVIVIEDVDDPAGVGALIGEVHANILLALGCVGVVTNGAVRDLPDIRPTEFQMFAGNVAVSHAYAHIFDFGSKVEVGGSGSSARRFDPRATATAFKPFRSKLLRTCPTWPAKFASAGNISSDCAVRPISRSKSCARPSGTRRFITRMQNRLPC